MRTWTFLVNGVGIKPPEWVPHRRRFPSSSTHGLSAEDGARGCISTDFRPRTQLSIDYRPGDLRSFLNERLKATYLRRVLLCVFGFLMRRRPLAGDSYRAFSRAFPRPPIPPTHLPEEGWHPRCAFASLFCFFFHGQCHTPFQHRTRPDCEKSEPRPCLNCTDGG